MALGLAPKLSVFEVFELIRHGKERAVQVLLCYIFAHIDGFSTGAVVEGSRTPTPRDQPHILARMPNVHGNTSRKVASYHVGPSGLRTVEVTQSRTSHGCQ